MKRHGAKLVSLAVLVASVFVSEPAAAAVGRTSSGQRPVLAADVLVRLNVIRIQHARIPLKRSAKLTLAASRHSSEMVADGYFAHESSDGSPFWRRVRRFYGRWPVGENLLSSTPGVGAGRAVEFWMASPGHRATMLDSEWREVGISAVHAAAAPGTYHGQAVTVITADFGARR